MTQQISLKTVSHFLKYEEFLKSKFLVQTCDLLINSLPGICDDDKHDDLRHILEKYGIRNDTLMHLYLTPGKRKIIGVTSYLVGTPELLATQDSVTKNLVEQGLTVDSVFLYNLCIDSKKRRNGHAKKMLQDGEEYIRKSKDHKKIVLFVSSDNPPAVSLYNNTGYKVLRATLTGFLMEKNLH